MTEITRSKDGVPIWNGEASTFQEFEETALIWEQSIAMNKRYLCGPKLLAELTGAAKRLVAGKPHDWVSHSRGVRDLMKHLRACLGKPLVSDLTEHLNRYFKSSRRRPNETMNDYITRKCEVYLRACQALQRVLPHHEERSAEAKPKGTPQWNTSRRSSWDSMGATTTEDQGETQAAAPVGQEPEDADDDATERETEDPWRWWQPSQSWWTTSSWWTPGYGGYGSSWYGTGDWEWSPPSWQTTSEAPRPPIPDLLPDFVQGWYLLQDSGLDAGEKNMIMAALGGNFALQRVAQELRNQWSGQEAHRRRESANRQSGYWGDGPQDDLEENPEAENDDGLEPELDEEDQAMLTVAEEEAQEAMAAMEQARVANCPQPAPQSAKIAEQVEASSSFICFNDVEPETAYATGITTAEAVQQGKAVIDGGATRTLASVPAMEAIMSLNNQKYGNNGVSAVDLKDRPIFGFGNGSENQCTSTIHLRIASDEQPGDLKVHCLDHGSGPLLLSVDSLRKLGAIIDFEADLICFRNLNDCQIVQVERSSTGHQLLPVTEDFMKQAHPAKTAIPSLREIFSRQATKLNMAVAFSKLNAMTKEQLRAHLFENYHEHAYVKWTKVEIKQRILELQGDDIENLRRGPALTATQTAVAEVRRAAKKKASLVQLCQEKYHMEVGRNDTIAILEAKVMKQIYENTEPEPEDIIGFGKNSALQYRDMLSAEHNNYATWVTTMARENLVSGCDPRLYRLARWLNTHMSKTTMANPKAMVPAAKKVTMGYRKYDGQMPAPSEASSGSGHQETQDQKIDALAEVLRDLKDEIRELKGEKARKQRTSEATDSEMPDESDTSFYKINTPPAKTPAAQRDELQQKRNEAMRRYVACACVVHLCVQMGIHVTWEMPEKCQAWRLPLLNNLRVKYDMYMAVTKGCAVNHRSEPQGQLTQQGWKILTTSKRLSENLNLPCRCPRSYNHGTCSGKKAPMELPYTKEYSQRVARILKQELSFEATLRECTGSTDLVPSFGEGEFCTCGEVCLPKVPQECASCLKGRVQLQVQEGMFQEDCDDESRVTGENDDDMDTSGDVYVVGDGKREVFSEAQVQKIEARAKELLEKQQFSHGTCEQVLKSLPNYRPKNHRSVLQEEHVRYLSFGLYAYGNHYGVTKSTLKFPNICRYILAYVQHWSKEQVECTSFVVNDNGTLKVHRDNHNRVGSRNCLIGVTNYQDGGLWLAGPPQNKQQPARAKVLPNGKTELGHVVSTRHRVVHFDAKQWHATEAWHGDRVVVSAFVSRGWDEVGSEVQGLLRTLGFPVPASVSCAEAMVVKSRGPWSGPLKNQGKAEHEAIKRKLYLLHAATGHGSTRHMIDALKRRNAKPLVLQLAKEFTCSICQERAKVKPRQVASLEPLPPKFHTVSADIGHWMHPQTKEHQNFMVVMDEGSRFRVAKILTKGQKQTPSGAVCTNYLSEGWFQIFGKPKTLRLDPAGSFRGEHMSSFCDRHGIYLDIIPGEAHWQIGVTEQAVQGLKQLMDKLAAADPEVSAEECLSVAVSTFNQREMVRGFSPTQHVLGHSPDSTGRHIHSATLLPEEPILSSSPEELKREARLRAEAEKALADWTAQQRVTKALNSRTRPHQQYQPGDLVFFWRTQESGQGKRSPGTKHGRFLGPARILATEVRRNPDGSTRDGHAIWCVRGRQLIKCSPEQLRPASTREELVESLSEDQGTPWTFSRLSQELGGNQYEDISAEVPDDAEWRRAQDVTEEVAPARHRLTRKRPPPGPLDQETTESMDELLAETTPTDPVRRSSASAASGRRRPEPTERGYSWWSEVKESAWQPADSNFWSEAHAAVAVEVDMPQQGQAWNRATRDLGAYLACALKKRAVEVSEKRLTTKELEQFKQAKMIEVKNFLAANAFEVLPDHIKPSKEQAVGMRWILTWKMQDSGLPKAKARAVLLGYQDPSYEHRATTAPVMTRQTRQLLLQLAANQKWRIMKGDVSGAFLQGREYPDELFCIPCPEICQEMGLPANTVTRLKKACYGLVDAPLEWYKTVAAYLESLGLERLWSDACAWVWRKDGVLRGMISGHVDDFIFAGSDSDQEWQSLLAQIKAHFKWGDWDLDNFTQCGVQVETTKDGFTLSQPRYLEGVSEIHVNATRRKTRQAATSDREKSQLRGLLGALSWHSQQVAPHLAADVSMLLSEVTHSQVETIFRANALLTQAKARSDHKLKIQRCVSEQMILAAWVDAGSQNRHDGGSTQGVVIGAAPAELLQGEVTQVSLMAWHSNRIDRSCRSPGAAETQAAVNGEDALYYARFQWSEMLYGNVNPRQPDEVVRRVTGCLITDSRNVYDKLSCEVVSIKGAEKRTNIEALALKESQQNTGLIVRWVHSEAQLANSLTKMGGKNEIEMFYRLGQSWRIVEDPEMQSARRRREAGLEPLAQKEKQNH
ncbi:RE1 [Symbiodinium sp. CCMP2592]|nr:RE1 [Symbiodinium sp. CCMP2592]